MKGIRIKERSAGIGEPGAAAGPSGERGVKGAVKCLRDDAVATRCIGRSQIILKAARRA
jgi:hypothetical protein